MSETARTSKRHLIAEYERQGAESVRLSIESQLALCDELRRVKKHVTFRVMFRRDVQTHQKRFTLRNYKIAKPEEIVSSNFGPIRIVALEKRTPRWVGDHLWREEGFASSDQFFATWADMHPDDDLDKPRWLHEFRFLGVADV